VLSDLFHRDRCRPILARLAAEPPGAVVTSAIVAHELAYGAARSARRAENERRLASLLADVEPLPFTLEDARAAGKIRAALAAAGTPIGPYDALVAGQARARGLVVVTGDTREFARVEGLETDDWRGGSGGDEGLR
jgi:tRNA(fMet)-specific endonuclease VapC